MQIRLFAITAALQFFSLTSFSQEIITEFWPNKNKASEGAYNIVGNEQGLWRFWYETGVIKEESEYHNGLLHGRVAYYYENGQLMDEGYFFNGLPDSLR